MAYVDFSVLEDIKNCRERQNKETELVEQCIAACQESIVQCIRNKGYTQLDIGSQLDMSRDWISHIMAGRKRFPIDRLASFAAMLHTSCNELVMGEKKAILLPNRLSAMVCKILDFPEKKKQRLCEYWTQEYRPYMDKPSVCIEDSLMSDRLIELAEDLCVIPENMLSPLKRLESENISASQKCLYAVQRITIQKVKPRILSPIIFMARNLDISVDYLLAKDYTTTSEILYSRSPSRSYTLSDFMALRVLRLYLNLPEDKQIELISDILATS